MHKKIDVFINSAYLWSTNSYKRCKDAKKNAEDFFKYGDVQMINAHLRKHNLTKNDKIKITAFFDRSK